MEEEARRRKVEYELVYAFQLFIIKQGKYNALGDDKRCFELFREYQSKLFDYPEDIKRSPALSALANYFSDIHNLLNSKKKEELQKNQHELFQPILKNMPIEDQLRLTQASTQMYHLTKPNTAASEAAIADAKATREIHGKDASQFDTLDTEMRDALRCNNCSQLQTQVNHLKKCGKCRGAQYCGPVCQKAHWKQHKKVCQAAVCRKDAEARNGDGAQSSGEAASSSASRSEGGRSRRRKHVNKTHRRKRRRRSLR